MPTASTCCTVIAFWKLDTLTPLQARAAFDQLEGTLTHDIAAIDRKLFDLAAKPGDRFDVSALEAGSLTLERG